MAEKKKRKTPKVTCGAVCRDGHLCKKAPMKGRTRCRNHGGKALRGEEHPNFKTGKFMQIVPLHMKAKYEMAARDGELLSLDRDIRYATAMLLDAIERSGTGEAEGLWMTLRKVEAAMRGARDDPEQMISLLTQLGTIIRQGASWVESNRDIRQMMEQRRKLVESERKRAVELNMNVTLQQFSAVMMKLYEVMSEHVENKRVVATVFNEVERHFEGLEAADGASELTGASGGVN